MPLDHPGLCCLLFGSCRCGRKCLGTGVDIVAIGTGHVERGVASYDDIIAASGIAGDREGANGDICSGTGCGEAT